MDKIKNIIEFPRTYWALNLIQMIEILAYWTVLIQLPVYIAQKDAVGGLHWAQSDKALVFLIWALAQRLTPMIAGIYADKKGYKKTMSFAFAGIICGYLIMGTQQSFWLFTLGTLILGICSGVLKPVLLGSVSYTLNPSVVGAKNASTGWGIYYMLLNLAAFFAPPLTVFLKGFSWSYVFYGSAVLILLNYIVLFSLKEFKNDNISSSTDVADDPKEILKSLKSLSEPKVIVLVAAMSGFAVIYMQFYETLPNFLSDWSDTSGLVQTLGLPDFMTINTDRGLMLSYEWIYNINTGFTVLFIAVVARLFSFMKRPAAIIIGILVASAGMTSLGISVSNGYLALAAALYTLGEMITNPKCTEYFSEIAPKGEKAGYLGAMQISWAIGLGGGSWLGGWLYGTYSEKAELARRFLLEKYQFSDSIKLENAFAKLQEISGMNAPELTNILNIEYNPGFIWYVFAGIGIVSATGLFAYTKLRKV